MVSRIALVSAMLLAWTWLAFPVLPGVMTWDSFDQLRQARENSYNDWQPPVMARLWRELLPLHDGPGSMLFFHCGMLLAAAALLYMWAASRRYVLAPVFLLLPLLPWVLNFEFVIWKDVGLAFSWLLAVALALHVRARERASFLWVAAAAIFFGYGLLVRGNSLFGGLLLAPFLLSCLRNAGGRRAFAAVALCCALAWWMLPKAFNSLVRAEATKPIAYVMFDDVAALTLAGVQLEPPYFSEAEALGLRRCLQLIVHQIGAPFCLTERFEDSRKAGYPALRAAWTQGLARGFPEYLGHRWSAFVTLIRSPVVSPYYHKDFRVPAGPKYDFDSRLAAPTADKSAAVALVDKTAAYMPGVFKPYVWILLSMAATILLWRQSREGPAFWMLPLSGTAYALSYLPFTPAGDFRYVYWTCLITTLGMMIWLARALSGGTVDFVRTWLTSALAAARRRLRDRL
jgi:hypothetical protein